MLVACSDGTLVARLPALHLVAVSCCSHAVTRGLHFLTTATARSQDWAASSSLSHAISWPRSLRVLWDSFLRRKLENKWILRQASVQTRSRDGGLQRRGPDCCGPSILMLMISCRFSPSPPYFPSTVRFVGY